MATLSVDITLRRRDFTIDVAFEVSGALALVGPSGAGKSSILRAVAGLETPGTGRVTLDGAAWFSAGSVDRPADRRPVGFVFQEYALFPHMSVADNVAFGGRARAVEMMERLAIAHLAAARPGELSGGERQRVALARALAREPDVLLLDEPTAALDVLTGDRVRVELAQLIGELGLPTVVVTHDFDEAVMLAEHVGVLVDGTLRQVGTPAQLVDAPGDPYVAGLTGHNVLFGTARTGADGRAEVTLDAHPQATLVSDDPPRGRVAVLVHPSRVDVREGLSTAGEVNVLRGVLTSVVPAGDRVRVRVGSLAALLPATDGDSAERARGEVVSVTFPVGATRLVAADRFAGSTQMN